MSRIAMLFVIFIGVASAQIQMPPETFVIALGNDGSNDFLRLIDMDRAQTAPIPAGAEQLNGQKFADFVFTGTSAFYKQTIRAYMIDKKTSEIYLGFFDTAANSFNFKKLQDPNSPVANKGFTTLAEGGKTEVLGVTIDNAMHFVEPSGVIVEIVDSQQLPVSKYGIIQKIQMTEYASFYINAVGARSTAFKFAALTDRNKLIIGDKWQQYSPQITVHKTIDLDALALPSGIASSAGYHVEQLFAGDKSAWIIVRYDSPKGPLYFVRQVHYQTGNVVSSIAMGRRQTLQILDADFKTDTILMRENENYVAREANGTHIDSIANVFSPTSGYLSKEFVGSFQVVSEVHVLHMNSITPNFMRNYAFGSSDYTGISNLFGAFGGGAAQARVAGATAANASAPTAPAKPKPLNLIDPETKEDFEALFKRDILFKGPKIDKIVLARALNRAGKGNLQYFMKDLPTAALNKLGFYYNTNAIYPNHGTDNNEIDLAHALDQFAELFKTGVCQANLLKAKP